MEAGESSCSCANCGTVCPGLFRGCPDVWAAGSTEFTPQGPRPSAAVLVASGDVPASVPASGSASVNPSSSGGGAPWEAAPPVPVAAGPGEPISEFWGVPITPRGDPGRPASSPPVDAPSVPTGPPGRSPGPPTPPTPPPAAAAAGRQGRAPGRPRTGTPRSPPACWLSRRDRRAPTPCAGPSCGSPTRSGPAVRAMRAANAQDSRLWPGGWRRWRPGRAAGEPAAPPPRRPSSSGGRPRPAPRRWAAPPSRWRRRSGSCPPTTATSPIASRRSRRRLADSGAGVREALDRVALEVSGTSDFAELVACRPPQRPGRGCRPGAPRRGRPHHPHAGLRPAGRPGPRRRAPAPLEGALHELRREVELVADETAAFQETLRSEAYERLVAVAGRVEAVEGRLAEAIEAGGSTGSRVSELAESVGAMESRLGAVDERTVALAAMAADVGGRVPGAGPRLPLSPRPATATSPV